MSFRLILVSVLVGAFAGCASERSASSAEVARPNVALPTLLENAYQRDDDGSLSILDRLGEPQRVTREPVENRHVPGQTDTLRTLVFDGLEMEVYAVTGGKEILQEVRVTGEGYETAEGLGVGSSRAAVRDVLGTPARTEGATVTYEIASGPDDPTSTQLHIRYDGDRVASMVWSYYVD